MIYAVYRQISKPYPKTDKPWDLICETEGEDRHYNWNKIVRALTNETVARQSDQGIWWMVLPKEGEEQ